MIKKSYTFVYFRYFFFELSKYFFNPKGLVQHENFMKIRSFTLRKGNWLYFERHIWEGDRDKFLPRERQKVVVTWAPPGPISNVQIASLSVQVWKRKLKKFSLVYALIPSKSKIPRPDVLISLKICLNKELIFSSRYSVKFFDTKKNKNLSKN